MFLAYLDFLAYLESSTVVDNLAHLATEVNRIGLLFSFIQCTYIVDEKMCAHKCLIVLCTSRLFNTTVS